VSERIRLISIEEDGTVGESGAPPLPPYARQLCESMVAFYKKKTFDPPWTGYLALRGGKWIGTCAFKGPPVENKVEIAYHTFPELENKGVATLMGALLVNIAQAMDPRVLVTARTLPEENASTRVLKKLGFTKLGNVHDPEDGSVWEWALRPESKR